MNWGTFKKNIIDLGFAEEDELSDIGVAVRATNRALSLLSTMEQKEKVSHIELEKSEQYHVIELNLIEDFSSKSNKVPKIGNDLISNSFYEVDTLYIPGEIEGNVHVFYNALRSHLPIAVKEDDKIDLQEELIPFLQLLTAYFIWLDDDEVKAKTYYVQFQESYAFYKQNSNTFAERPTITFHGGVSF